MQQKDDDQLERQAEQNHVHDGGQDEMQPENQQPYPNMQTMNNPQAQAAKSENGSKQVSYSVLLPLLLPLLEKKQAMLLQANYFKLQKDEISKEGFVRNLRNIEHSNAQADHNSQLSQQTVQVSEQNHVHDGGQDEMQPENQQQYPNMQTMNNPQAQAAKSENGSKQVSYSVLLPLLLPLLEKKQAMLLQENYFKLQKNEIPKEGFVRNLRNIEHSNAQADHNSQLSQQTVQVSEQNHVHDGGQDEMQPENQQQYPNMQTMNNPQAQAAKSENGSKQVSYSVLLPLLLPLLEKKQAMLLQENYFKLQKNEIPKEGFVRHLRNIEHSNAQADHNSPLYQQTVQVSEQNRVHDGGQDEMQPENQQQYPNMHTVNNPQAQAAKSENRSKQVSYGVLIPLLLPLLEKKQAMLLQANYFKLRKNEISKEGFVRHLRNIEHSNAQADHNSQTGSHQSQAESHSPRAWHMYQ
ncbi:hypothetical protein IFM89_016730 [Coptis chinensis]|uniref:RST domain-containing protein n=1 Tax=Coptis chinensis TaxID=261450 RepID=A0A835MEW2_9MAGN|nr:hypothetical protein IFM89_016730 [Coptis chinensis]